jgi:hypothetical protein
MLMEISMRVNGSMIKLMDMGLINMLTVRLMSENGLKISSMEKELKNGQMVQNMKDTIKMVRSMGMDVLLLLTGVHIQDNSKIMKFLGWESTYGLTAKCMKDIGRRTRCMVKAY